MKSFARSINTEIRETPPGVWFPRTLLSLSVAGVLLAWSLSRAVFTVSPCQMPREWDVLRDISIAQSLEDGAYPEDPSLSGEVSWYNPLTGMLLASVRSLNGQSLMRIAVMAGPFVNILAPAAFYLLVALLFGHSAALAGLCLFLFGKEGTSPSHWTCAYTPWLLAPVYSTGLLFLTLALFKKALEKKTAGYFIMAGLLLGITFLAHTAPAVIAGATMTLLTIVEMYRAVRRDGLPGEARRLAACLFMSLCIAFFVSLPYTGPILWRYQFQVRNPWPSLYASQNVELQNLTEQIWNSCSLRNLIALLGIVGLFPGRSRLEVRLLTCWCLVVCTLMVQQYVWQALRLNGIILPSIVPGHHAAIHLAAVRNVLFGTGILFLGKWVYRFFACTTSRIKTSGSVRLSLESFCIWTMAALAGLCLYVANPYSRRVDFQPPGGTAHHDLYERHVPMYEWIRDNIPPEAVILCPDETLGINVVMPSGRKLVNPMLLYFNPYVDRGPKTLRQEALLDALNTGNKAALCEQSKDYSMLLLLLDEPVDKTPPFSTELHRAGGSVLFEIHTCLRQLS